MKIASRILSLVILIVIATVYMGCKKSEDEKKTEEQTQLEKLKGVWTIVSANDGGDRTEDFIDDTDPNNKMKLTLEGNYAEGGIYNYSLTGPRPVVSPWPASGTWKFGTNKLTELIRDPNTENEIPMNYTVTDSDLIIDFVIPADNEGWPGGRTGSVVGEWTFTFTK
jgi:hypothetical protein